MALRTEVELQAHQAVAAPGVGRRLRRRQQWNLPESLPLLTVIVPVYDEAPAVEQLLGRAVAAEPWDKQIIVVDDGSTDGTAALLDRWERAGRIQRPVL